jgi:hypothetical protein
MKIYCVSWRQNDSGDGYGRAFSFSKRKCEAFRAKLIREYDKRLEKFNRHIANNTLELYDSPGEDPDPSEVEEIVLTGTPRQMVMAAYTSYWGSAEI